MVLPADRTGIQDLGAVSEADKHRPVGGLRCLVQSQRQRELLQGVDGAWHYARRS